MRIVSEGGRTWGVIENPLRDPPFHKTYVDIEDGDLPHGRTCTCFPCEQANERMDRDDPSVGGYDPTN